ncbi:MAG: hypothetical protein QOE92_1750 [Chloroflexota bacterium]|nr:hypothetical protein [Chloroflexota bacterium]
MPDSDTLKSAGVVIAIVVVVLLLTGLAVTLFVVRRVRARRARRLAERREAERAAELERRLGTTGVLALAATLEGVKLAALAARVGAEVGRQGLKPAVAGSLRTLADLTERDRPSMRRAVAADGTATLMFSDIEGSTSINERLGAEGWLELLREHEKVVRRHIKKHRGQVIKTLGDSFMVAFPEVEPAVRCAMEIQRGLAGGELEDDPEIRVRIGLHTGEVTREKRDVFGLNVALAARVAAQAGGGEILVSSAVKAELGGGDDIRLGRGRRVQLKGISGEETLYPVRWEA